MKVRKIRLFTRAVMPLKQFYECLGMVFTHQQIGSDPAYVSADCGGVTVELHVSQFAIPYPIEECLSLEVEDIVAVRAKLAERGIPVGDIANESTGFRMFVYDQESRGIELFQPVAKKPEPFDPEKVLVEALAAHRGQHVRVLAEVDDVQYSRGDWRWDSTLDRHVEISPDANEYASLDLRTIYVRG